MSIARTVQDIVEGDTSAIDGVERCLSRIDQHECDIHAWVEVAADTARETADRLDAMVRNGLPLGPLHGVPVGIKDIVDVRGMPTRAGSRLRENHLAKEDAPVVRRLRAAGAIILGKTVTTEFACFDPPPTRNPWNASHTPGGSSSGSAAAVSLGMCIAAIGSQTGGSITRPASYCGVAGLKPRYGSISLDGVIPVSTHLDHIGPIALQVEDLARMFGAIVGEDIRENDFESVDRLGPDHNFGVLREYFMESADPEVYAITDRILGMLSDAGARLIDVKLPYTFADVHAMHRRIMAYDVSRFHNDAYRNSPSGFGARLAELIEEGLGVKSNEYEQALEHKQTFQRDCSSLFAQTQTVLTPSTVTAAPRDLSTTGDPRFNSPWSYAGLATVTIPCGVTEQHLPCGLQLIGAGAELPLLASAARCEAAIGFRESPKDVRPNL